MSDTNQRLEKLEASLERTEKIMLEIHSNIKKTTRVATKLEQFIWVIEKLGSMMKTIGDGGASSFLLQDEEPPVSNES